MANSKFHALLKMKSLIGKKVIVIFEQHLKAMMTLPYKKIFYWQLTGIISDINLTLMETY